jgi:phosphate-selective porin OprO and OprP
VSLPSVRFLPYCFVLVLVLLCVPGILQAETEEIVQDEEVLDLELPEKISATKEDIVEDKRPEVTQVSLVRHLLTPPLVLKSGYYITDFELSELSRKVQDEEDFQLVRHVYLPSRRDKSIIDKIELAELLDEDKVEDEIDHYFEELDEDEPVLARHSLVPPFLLYTYGSSIIPSSGEHSSAYQYDSSTRRTIGIPLSVPDEIDKAIEPSINLTIELQSDFVWTEQDTANKEAFGEIGDGASFRRARFGLFGELYKTIEYRTEWDFASDARPRFLDNWIAFTDLPVVKNVIIGHFFEPFSLERYTPNRFITFTERALTDSFAPARNMGIMFYGDEYNERFTWAVGGFRSGSDDFGDDVSVNSGYAGTVHTTFLPWYKEDSEYSIRMMHIGASGTYRAPGDDPVRFGAPPSVRLRQQDVASIPRFVDTGDIMDASHFMQYGYEAAWVHGPFSVQGEMIDTVVNRRQNENPRFRSAYVYGSVFLTGESRSYSPSTILGRFREGIFQRVKPYTNFLDRTTGNLWSGLGAVELAARWSFMDLNDAGIRGGYMQEWTYGLNWYLNPFTKVMFNYVRPEVTKENDERSTADMYVVRWQFEY